MEIQRRVLRVPRASLHDLELKTTEDEVRNHIVLMSNIILYDVFLYTNNSDVMLCMI